MIEHLLFWVSYMHVFCIFVFAPVQRNWACFTLKDTLEICSLSFLLLLLLLLLLAVTSVSVSALFSVSDSTQIVSTLPTSTLCVCREGVSCISVCLPSCLSVHPSVFHSCMSLFMSVWVCLPLCLSVFQGEFLSPSLTSVIHACVWMFLDVCMPSQTVCPWSSCQHAWPHLHQWCQ